MPAKKRYPEGLGRALAGARSIRGWRQHDLARVSGVGASAISEYERGIRRPEMPTLERLAAAVEFSIPALFELSSMIRRRGRERSVETEAGEPAGRPLGGPELAR